MIKSKISAAEPENFLSMNTITEAKLEGDEINTSTNVSRAQTMHNEESKNDFEIINESEMEEGDELNNPYGNFKIDFEFNKEVNELFFNFNANLLSGYHKFLNTDFYSSNNSPCLEVLFKVDEFLSQVSSSDRAFYEKFISETQIFGDFL
jgi:hypothetical protein